jgi:hypothetical protein
MNPDRNENAAQRLLVLTPTLVEDDADAAESLQAFLGDCGYEVHTVMDGRAALAAAFVLQATSHFMRHRSSGNEWLRTRS